MHYLYLSLLKESTLTELESMKRNLEQSVAAVEEVIKAKKESSAQKPPEPKRELLVTS
jgi:hypothetical protein